MKKTLLLMSFLIFLISIILQCSRAFQKDNYSLFYEYINVKDVAMAYNITKTESNSDYFVDSLNHFLNVEKDNSTSLIHDDVIWKSVEFQRTSYSREEKKIQERNEKLNWHLPTEMGRVTQNPSYSHPALDITSPRGTNEIIFPVANGVISGIYRDNAGALIVTVLHRVNDEAYTSLYAHLSRYADGLYVGKPVTIHDSLGWMGATGHATGVHLHLSVVDCALFDPNDSNCSDLNHFFYYIRARVASGHWGLGTYIWVPTSWNHR